MDRQLLRNILQSQSANFSADVLKKMNMLESGEIFTDPERYVQEILNSFTVAPVSGNAGIVADSLKSAYSAKEAINRVVDRKKALAAKIAALRGITLPGDYLNNKRGF